MRSRRGSRGQPLGSGPTSLAKESPFGEAGLEGKSKYSRWSFLVESVFKWLLLVALTTSLLGGLWFLWQGGWPPWSWQGSWGKSFFYNEISRKALKAEDLLRAESFNLKSQRVSSDSLELQINLGIILAAKNSLTEAEKVFSLVEQRSLDPRLQFVSRFNLGVLLGSQERTDEALDWYQKALKVNPHHKPTQINMELLVRDQQQNQKNKNQNKDSKDPNQQPQNQSQNKDQNDSSNGNDSNKDKSKDSKQKKNEDPKKDPHQQDQDKDSAADQKKDKDESQNNQQPQYEKNKDKDSSGKKQPRPFQSQDLDAGDVQKILGELKNQEQRIRAEFQRKNTKEKTREKDW